MLYVIATFKFHKKIFHIRLIQFHMPDILCATCVPCRIVPFFSSFLFYFYSAGAFRCLCCWCYCYWTKLYGSHTFRLLKWILCVWWKWAHFSYFSHHNSMLLGFWISAQKRNEYNGTYRKPHRLRSFCLLVPWYVRSNLRSSGADLHSIFSEFIMIRTDGMLSPRTKK